MRIVLAFRVFFAVLFNRYRAGEVQKLLASPPAPKPDVVASLPEPRQVPVPTATKASTFPTSTPADKKGRSEALTLLSTLQREARLVDMVQEPLDQYSDAQIGAAARDVLRDTKKCLDRLFGLKPLSDSAEGERVQLPEELSPVKWKVIGAAKSSGAIVHPGWVATKVDLPNWTGKGDEHWVVSPIEVEA